MRVLILMLAVALCLGATPQASASHPMVQRLGGALEEAWSIEVGEPLTSAVSWRTFGLKLLAAHNSEAGPRIYAIPLDEGRLGTEVRILDTESLPAELELVAVQPVDSAMRLALAGSLGGRPVVHTAVMMPRLDLEPWVALPPIPSPEPEVITELASVDEYLVVYTARDRGGEIVNTGWIRHLGVPDDVAEWIELKIAPDRREGHAALALRDKLVLAGGTMRGGDRAVGMIELSIWEGPVTNPWRRVLPGVPGRIRAVVGAAAPSAIFLTPREPLRSVSDDQPTSLTIWASYGTGEGFLSPWSEMPTSLPGAEVRALAWDAANELLIIVSAGSEPDKLRLTAVYPPPFANQRRPTIEDVQLERARQLATNPPRIGLDDAILRSREGNGFALVVVTSGDEKEDLAVRVEMSKNAFRYMTMGTELTYLQGADAAAVTERYGRRATPAYLLLDKEGALRGAHEGSIPTPAELFELTSPARQPPADP